MFASAVIAGLLVAGLYIRADRPLLIRFPYMLPPSKNIIQVSYNGVALPLSGCYHIKAWGGGNGTFIIVKTSKLSLSGSVTSINGRRICVTNRVVNVVVANQTGGEVDVEFIPKREVSSIILPLLALSALGGVVAYALRVLGFE